MDVHERHFTHKLSLSLLGLGLACIPLSACAAKGTPSVSPTNSVFVSPQPVQPMTLPPGEITSHTEESEAFVFDPPVGDPAITGDQALDAAWSEFPRRQVDTQQALLGTLNDPVAKLSRLVYIVRYEGVCIPVTAENQPDSGRCSLNNHEFNVVVDALTGEVLRAYTVR